MATIYENLTLLLDVRKNIKTSIENKGVEVGDVPFTEYYSKIDDIVPIVTLPNGTKFKDSTFEELPDGFDFSEITDASYMFSNCKNLLDAEITIDASNITNMSYMFENCSHIVLPPHIINSSNVTDMSGMFNYCSMLDYVLEMDTSNVTNMSNMFLNCSSLTTVPAFDTSNVASMNYMFRYCTTITNLGGFIGLKVNLDLSPSDLITRESMLNVFNEAATITNGYSISISQTVYDRLTEDDIAIAVAKGWNVSIL